MTIEYHEATHTLMISHDAKQVSDDDAEAVWEYGDYQFALGVRAAKEEILKALDTGDECAAWAYDVVQSVDLDAIL